MVQETYNWVPQESEEMKRKRVPGPGESGFTYREQINLCPKDELDRKKITIKQNREALSGHKN